jgi:serine protease Do
MGFDSVSARKPDKAIPMFIRQLNFALAAVLLTLLGQNFAKAAEAPLETAMAAVFSVHSADAEDRFLGSAFLWGLAGDVAVTNAHVVQDAIEVRLIDATGQEEIAMVIARDPLRDVAVIAVKPGRQGLVAASTTPALGAEVWALGAPVGVEFSVTKGMISGLGRQVDAAAPIRMLQHDAAINPGSSGGPLVDEAGFLMGMNSQIADGSRMFVGIAYAIGVKDLGRIVTGLVEETLAPLPALGLKLRPMDRKLAAVLGVRPTGLIVEDITAGGIAAQAGLLAGDLILALNGQILQGAGDLAFAVEAAQLAGDVARLSVSRNAELLVLTLDFGPTDAGLLALRDVSGAMPQRTVTYTLTSLGMALDDNGVVTALTPNSPALLAGVALGDRIAQVNGRVLQPGNLGQVFDTATLLLLQSEGHTRHVLIDPFAKNQGFRPVGGANVLDPDVVVF